MDLDKQQVETAAEPKVFWNAYSAAALFRSGREDTGLSRDEWGRNLIARLERAVEAEAAPGEHMADTVDRLGLQVALVRGDGPADESESEAEREQEEAAAEIHADWEREAKPEPPQGDDQ